MGEISEDDPERDWTLPGVFETAPGVYRVPLPLPSDALRAVNVYVLPEDDGAVLVDSGWALAQAQEALRAALSRLDLGLEAIKRFLVTHVHRDHYTQAVALRRLFRTEILIGRDEQPNLEAVVLRPQEVRRARAARLRKWGAAALADLVGEGDHPVSSFYELPDGWLDDAAEIALAARTLRCTPTPGHTRGHCVFSDAEAALLFSGDHVLPHITPSLGLEPVPGPSPLADYLASLLVVKAMPDLALLPAHGPTGGRSHQRVDELLAHHERRLEATEAAIVHGASTPFEAARLIPWTRRERRFDELDAFNQMLAVGETAAHLRVLVEQGRLHEHDSEGLVTYS